MVTTETMLNIVDGSIEQATDKLAEQQYERAATWAQIATAQSIAALATAAQAIADAINSQARG